MKPTRLLTAAFTLALSFYSSAAFMSAQAQPKLTDILSTPFQPTGITVSKNNRVFVNFPNWNKPYQNAVAEVVHGKLKPFPNQEWNTWKPGLNPQNHFVCVQSVVVDDDNNLWVLDPAAPQLKDVVYGGAKLVKIDLQNNKVVRIIRFDELVAPQKSYLNDVRFDLKNQTAYITESGLGALIVVDLKTGKARRVLGNDASTKAEPGFKLTVDGRGLRNPQGFTPVFHTDGIALDQEGQYLYYHAVGSKKLYRIDTAFLRDPQLTDAQLASHVEDMGDTIATDGMIVDNKGLLYLTSPTDSSIQWFKGQGSLETIVQDKKLIWPDTLSVGPDNAVYVTASQLHNTALFNRGRSQVKGTYHVYKFKP